MCMHPRCDELHRGPRGTGWCDDDGESFDGPVYLDPTNQDEPLTLGDHGGDDEARCVVCPELAVAHDADTYVLLCADHANEPDRPNPPGHGCDGPARCEDDSHLPDGPDLYAMTEAEAAAWDEAMDGEQTGEMNEWITDWAYWDFVGQEYVEWTDREVLMCLGKLVHDKANAAPHTIDVLLNRLEMVLTDYEAMKTEARMAAGSSPWERGET